jgi:hypothetical protein
MSSLWKVQRGYRIAGKYDSCRGAAIEEGEHSTAQPEPESSSDSSELASAEPREDAGEHCAAAAYRSGRREMLERAESAERCEHHRLPLTSSSAHSTPWALLDVAYACTDMGTVLWWRTEARGCMGCR